MEIINLPYFNIHYKTMDGITQLHVSYSNTQYKNTGELCDYFVKKMSYLAGQSPTSMILTR